MGRWCLVVCLTGCGLTLDLEEQPDGSVRDVSIDVEGADSGPPLDGGGPDAAVGDASAVDGGEGDVSVEPADVGPDALGECVPGCPIGQGCSGGMCWPLCGGEICFDGQSCISGACVAACDESSCSPGYECGDDGACVCASGPCGPGERCAPGGCTPSACEAATQCVDPAGAGCVDFSCHAGACLAEPRSVDSECGYCDPLTGDVHGFDNDRDGFVACSGLACEIEECDCDDDNPFINPGAVDLLANRDCDDVLEPALSFCIVDDDDDGAPVLERAPLGTCDRGDLTTVRALLNMIRTLPRLDCDDANDEVFPRQMEFMGTPITAAPCEVGRGECYDYNCDARHEREHPSFAHCHYADTRDACEVSGGWTREGGASDAGVPACGEAGQFVACRWVGERCMPGDATTTVQRCR